jgi:hypothetical protein
VRSFALGLLPLGGRADMRLIRVLRHETREGPVFISRDPETGLFHIDWMGESLGAYATPLLAAGDASVGSHWSASDGVDLGELGISDAPADWTPVAPDAR